jgi:predicted methyltransferase
MRDKKMNTLSRLLILISVTMPLSMLSFAAVADGWTVETLTASLDGSDRSDADKSRDAGRKPAEIVVLSGIEPGMTIMDLMASGGWYTEVLSIAAGPEGTVYAQNPPMLLEYRDGANSKALAARLADDRLPNVVRMDGVITEVDLEPGTLDVIFTALNFHDVYYLSGADTAAAELQAIYSLLKPDGVLVLIDHSGQPDADNAQLHRIPKQVVLDSVTQTGFVVEIDSDVLAHPEDDGTQMVFMPDMRGKTDRIVLVLRKE